jgi:hypothetical protein
MGIRGCKVLSRLLSLAMFPSVLTRPHVMGSFSHSKKEGRKEGQKEERKEGREGGSEGGKEGRRRKGCGCSSVIECLPNIHKALGYIPSTNQKKEKEEKTIQNILFCPNIYLPSQSIRITA